MKCRKLYIDEKQKNYNLVFFGSRGIESPKEVWCSILVSRNSDTDSPISKEIPMNQVSSISFGSDITLNCEYVEKEAIKNIEFVVEGELGITTAILVSFYIKHTDPNEINKLRTYTILQTELKPSLDEETEKYIAKLEDIPYKDFCVAIRDNNYADKQEGVSYSLIQRLSIIKNELWYLINYGLPILDKVKSGEVYDSVIIGIILRHPEVTNIARFTSFIDRNHTYKFDAKISTIYNLDIEISNSY